MRYVPCCVPCVEGTASPAIRVSGNELAQVATALRRTLSPVINTEISHPSPTHSPQPLARDSGSNVIKCKCERVKTLTKSPEIKKLLGCMRGCEKRGSKF